VHRRARRSAAQRKSTFPPRAGACACARVRRTPPAHCAPDLRRAAACHVTAQARLALGELRGALADAEGARAAAPKDAAAAALVEACEDALYDARHAATHTKAGGGGDDAIDAAAEAEEEPDAAALAFARQCASCDAARLSMCALRAARNDRSAAAARVSCLFARHHRRRH
jgi:hypothetical protein